MRLELDRDDVRALRKALDYVAARMSTWNQSYDLLVVTETEEACIEDILTRLEPRKR